MTVVTVGVLDKAAAAPFGDNSRMVGTLHRNAPASIEPVVNIHAALGVVNVGARSVGSGSD
jgi:hypothetical protein